MKSVQLASQGTDPGWEWPLDASQYDRTPYLYPTEKTALSALIDRYAAGQYPWTIEIEPPLVRLLLPIRDTFQLFAPTQRIRSELTRLLMREMHRHQTPFWAWTNDEWQEILNFTSPIAQVATTSRTRLMHSLLGISYILCGKTCLPQNYGLYAAVFASKVFGNTLVSTAVQKVLDDLVGWGYGKDRVAVLMPNIVGWALLLCRSPYLEDLTIETLENLKRQGLAETLQPGVLLLARVLAAMNIIDHLPEVSKDTKEVTHADVNPGVDTEWFNWCCRWRDISTLENRTKHKVFRHLIVVGKWLKRYHPDVVNPAQWDRELAAEYIAFVDRMLIGEWTSTRYISKDRTGKPLAPAAKASYIQTIRRFFQDCQDAELIPRRFNPSLALCVPRTIRALIGPDPRVIDTNIWKKLLRAGITLTADDVAGVVWSEGPNSDRLSWYPLEMIRAIIVVWLFAGLRSDELRRLRVGCIRWYCEDVEVENTGEMLSKDAVCLLDVPVNKTSTAFTKPVDPIVGEAIEAWEKVRPVQPSSVDPKTNEIVDFLFLYRNQRLGTTFLNNTLIPMLCDKAGVPLEDARGKITSHRGRATIATQLFNAKDPFSLFELQDWLGHRSLQSTQYYAKITPTKLAKSYEKADYFRSQLRSIDVLIDQDAIKSGAAAQGQPWMFYDLGHGYCTYDFFEQCPHRMACARCDFYQPKSALLLMLEESKHHLLQMKRDIALTELELAAVDNDLVAAEKLISDLMDVPTPGGPTPRQITGSSKDVIWLKPSNSDELNEGDRDS